MSALLIASSWVLGMAVGVVIDRSIALPAETLPAELALYEPESAVYFGEIDEVDMWSVQQRNTQEPCLVAIRGDFGGAVYAACGVFDARTIALSVPDPRSSASFEYVLIAGVHGSAPQLLPRKPSEPQTENADRSER